mgnify:CR=1 FL=1
MADQFGKPAPAFKRSSRYSMAGGVIMPKTKEDMIRDKERRASMMYFDELRERLRSGEIVLPPQRTTSLALGGSASEEPILSPPIGAFKTQRSHSAPSTPMTACFEQSSQRSVDPQTVEVLAGVTRSESEPSELPFLSTVQEGGTDSDATSACITGDDLVDSPVALTSPQFPKPSTEGQGQTVAADSSPTVDALSSGSPSDEPPALMPVLEESDDTESDEISTPSSVDAVPAAAALASSPSLKRRSMSMPSVNEAKPPTAASIALSTTTAPRPTVVRKQKSLSRFFFSNSDLARVERDSGKHVPVEEKNDGKASQTTSTANRKSLGGMLSRPKSSPALRTQARESRHAAVIGTNGNTVSSATSSISLATAHTPQSTQPGLNGSVAESDVPRATDAPTTVKTIKKRFSLSNLSSAFKRSKKSNEAPVPHVPAVPSAFKKESVANRTRPRQSDFADVPSGEKKEHAIPEPSQAEGDEVETLQEDTTETLISPTSSPVKTRPANRARSNTHMTSSSTGADRPGAPSSPKERSSIVSDTSSGFELDAELSHARLMLVSPQTRRNPSKTFQEILNVAPVTRQSKIIKLDTHMTRRSVEAIVLGPLLLASGDMRAVTEERDEMSAQGGSEAADAESEIAADEEGEREMGRESKPSERRGSDESSTTIGSGSNDTTVDSDLSDRSMEEYTDSQTSLETMSQSSCASGPHDKSGPVTPSSTPIDAFTPSTVRREGDGHVKVGREGRAEEEDDSDMAMVLPLPPDVQAVS